MTLSMLLIVELSLSGKVDVVTEVAVVVLVRGVVVVDEGEDAGSNDEDGR